MPPLHVGFKGTTPRRYMQRASELAGGIDAEARAADLWVRT
jgi:hypothetical protein